MPDSGRGQRGWRRRGVCWGKASRDEGLQWGSLCANNHMVQQPMDRGRTEGSTECLLVFFFLFLVQFSIYCLVKLCLTYKDSISICLLPDKSRQILTSITVVLQELTI